MATAGAQDKDVEGWVPVPVPFGLRPLVCALGRARQQSRSLVGCLRSGTRSRARARASRWRQREVGMGQEGGAGAGGPEVGAQALLMGRRWGAHCSGAGRLPVRRLQARGLRRQDPVISGARGPRAGAWRPRHKARRPQRGLPPDQGPRGPGLRRKGPGRVPGAAGGRCGRRGSRHPHAHGATLLDGPWPVRRTDGHWGLERCFR